MYITKLYINLSFLGTELKILKKKILDIFCRSNIKHVLYLFRVIFCSFFFLHFFFFFLVNEKMSKKEEKNITNETKNEITKKANALFNEIPFDTTFAPIPFNSNEPSAIPGSEMSENPSTQSFQGPPRNNLDANYVPKSYSLSELPEVEENTKPTEHLALTPNNLMLREHKQDINDNSNEIITTENEFEENIDELLETLPSQRRPDVSRANELNDENNSPKHENNEENNKDNKDSHLIKDENHPNVHFNDNNKKNNGEEDGDDDEYKEEEINILLDTLPYKKRHTISRSYTPNQTFIDDKGNHEEDDKDHHDKIHDLLEALPSQKRAAVTPQDTDDHNSSVNEYYVKVEEEEEEEETAEEKQNEEEFSHNISLFNLSSGSEHKSPSFLVSNHGHEIHGLEEELQEYRSHNSMDHEKEKIKFIAHSNSDNQQETTIKERDIPKDDDSHQQNLPKDNENKEDNNSQNNENQQQNQEKNTPVIVNKIQNILDTANKEQMKEEQDKEKDNLEHNKSDSNTTSDEDTVSTVFKEKKQPVVDHEQNKSEDDESSHSKQVSFEKNSSSGSIKKKKRPKFEEDENSSQYKDNNNEDKPIFETDKGMPRLIYNQSSRPRSSMYREEDSSDDEERKEDSMYLERFNKTGRLPPISDKSKLVRECYRERVEAITERDYDKADHLLDLSRRVQEAIIKNDEKERRANTLNTLHSKLETAKTELFTVSKDTKRIIEKERESNEQKLEELNKKHIDELTEFENKWNDEQCLRRFTKPSSRLIEMKHIETMMVQTKRYKEAKSMQTSCSKMESQESKQAQEVAQKEMIKSKAALLEKQAKEKNIAIDAANKRMTIVKRNRAVFEEPYRKRVETLQKQIDQLKSDGSKHKDFSSNQMVTSRSVSITRPQTSMRATQAMLQANRKSTIPKLAIKPLGVVLTKEKKQIMKQKQQISARK